MIPSNPGWKFGYVPPPGEWNNWWAKKVDYPGPIDQGGTGAQDAPTANYNLQQRYEVSLSPDTARIMSVISLRTDELAIVENLPLLGACKPGDWILFVDTGFNAAVNNATIRASGSDQIFHNGTPASTLVLANNGVQCILVATAEDGWRAETFSQGTGIGFAAGGIRTITESTAVDQTYTGDLCKILGPGINITLPPTGFIAGNAIAFDNADATNAVSFSVTSGDAPTALFAGDCMIVVADGVGGWWKAAYYTSSRIATQPVPTQIADTAYTLRVTDTGQYLQFTSNTPVTITVPTNADVPFSLGVVVIIEQYGTGIITLVGADGVALNGHNGLRSGGQYAVVQIKNGSNGSGDIWTVLGDAQA